MSGTRGPKKALNVALALARLGVHVFPVKTDGTKEPAAGIGSWAEVATTDSGMIAEWWAETHAGAEIGIHLGRSNLIAVDLDRHAGEADGVEERRAHDETHPLPATFSYVTKSGGEHHLYRDPEPGAHTQRGAVLPGVDIKAGRGYVVYWKKSAPDTLDVVDAPDWACIPLVTSSDAFSGTMKSWLDALPDGKVHPDAKAACKRSKADGIGHTDMLDIVAGIVREATMHPEGMRKHIEAARARYLQHPRAKAKAWDEAFEGSIRAQGAPGSRRPIRPFVPPPHLVRAMEEAPAVIEARDFFDPKEGLRTTELVEALRPNVAVGADGNPWSYDEAVGVWRKDKKVFTHRGHALLGNRFRREHSSLAEDVIFADPSTPQITGDPLAELINLEAGMYRWATNTLEPHDPDLLSTVRLPIAFDRNAECPHFDKWLSEVLHPEDVPLMWEVLGYLLMSGNPRHRAIALIGEGRNGKSLLLKIIGHLVGRENRASVTLKQMSEDKFAPANLFGKLVDIAGDIETDYLKDTSKFKAITGEDEIGAEFKGKDAFMFTPWAVPIFSANNLWQSSDRSAGYLKRWIFIHFPNTFTAGGLDEAPLFEESAGIFNKAMEALRGLMSRKDFSIGIHSQELLDDLQRESNPVLEWLTDDVDRVDYIKGDTTLEASKTLAYQRYVNWSDEAGRGRPLHRANFYKALATAGFPERKTMGQRLVVGIRIKGLLPSQSHELNHPA